MFSVKVQVRSGLGKLYIEDDIITNGIGQQDVKGVNITVERALGRFVSPDTITRLTKFIVVQLNKTKNTSNYKQIIEENINGCYFRVYVKADSSNLR